MRNPTLTALMALFAVVITALSGRAQNFDPVVLTPGSFTHDIIVESNGVPALPYTITATQGGGTALGDTTWNEIGLFLPPAQNVGFPPAGTTIIDQGNSNVSYTLPPTYSGNNAFFVDNTIASASATLSVPTTVTNLSFLGTSGGGSGTMNYTVHHADASTESGSIAWADWFNVTPFAMQTGGRVSPAGGISAFGQTNPRLYSRSITVSDASPVTAITFNYGSGGRMSVFSVSGNASGTNWTPIAVTGFNHDLVAETITTNRRVNATMDQGTNLVGNLGQNTWFEQGYAPLNPSSGLPAAGSIFISAANPTRFYQMPANYAANNAVLIDVNHQQVNITPASPTNYTAFAVLTAGGNIVGANIMTNLIIMQYANGTSETNLFFGYDWFNSVQPVAYTAAGRININGRGFNALGTTNPRLFESTFFLGNPGSVVTNIILRYQTAPFPNSTTFVLAVSATAGAIPPLLGTTTSTGNAVTGGSVTMSVTVAAGTTPFTFQWQKDGFDISDGPNISGATTTNLTVSNITSADEGLYHLVVNNVAGSATSPNIGLVEVSPGTDITSPNDLVAAYQPSGGSSPANEGPARAFDNTTTKYLNFGVNAGAAPFIGPIGVDVTPVAGATIVTGLRVYGANDAFVRDPVDYSIEGSTDGVNYFPVSSGFLTLGDLRNPAGQPINPLIHSIAEVEFVNTTPYTSYRVSFNNIKDAFATGILQIGEIELLGTLSPSAPAVLVDIEPPLSRTNFIGGSETLSVLAAGTPPLSYQWRTNGVAVGGATNASYTFSTLSGVNTYDVIISNAHGSTNSSVATIQGVAFGGVHDFVVNFHQAANFAAGAPNFEHITFIGQGAYSDPGNNHWNPLGASVDGDTSGFLSDPGLISSGLVNSGVRVVVTSTGDNGGLFTAAGGADGVGGNTNQGTPVFLLGNCTLVSGATVGTITLSNVPSGSYSLYLYGANFDGDRGANFAVDAANGGTAHNGISSATNSVSNSFFGEGTNYVYFEGVAPDSSGVIRATFTSFSNPISGQTGEGNFNGLQLIRTGEAPIGQPSISIQKLGANVVLTWSAGILQSSTNVAGPYNDVLGASSPHTNGPTANTQFYRAKVVVP